MSAERIHGHSGSGDGRVKPSPTYQSWRAMRKRCLVGRRGYKDRGIEIDPRWNSFENFLADMGERPPGMTLDRRDNDGDYGPDNCRWATPPEQGQNRRTTRLTPEVAVQVRWLCVDGGYSQREVARAFGFAFQTISKVVRRERWVNV